MNKTIKSLLAVALLSLVTLSAQAGVKIIGSLPNGDKIVRIKTVGWLTPSTATICKLTKEGELLPLNAATSSGVLGQVAAPAATASAAYLHKPDNTRVSQSGGNAVGLGVGTGGTGGAGGNGGNSAANGGTSNANGGGQFVPPGHVNNPSSNH